MRRVLVLLALGIAATLQASVPNGSIDAFIDSEMPSSGVPGLAYAVVQGGAISQTGERGVLRKGGDTKVSADTSFIIGSVSKSFTALAVMQLVEAGKIDLDAPISQFLDVFADQSSGSVTVRQLLSHTSGYSTYQGNISQTDFTMDDEALERRVASLAQMEPANKPEAEWEYSNANYQILGRLIEMVSGQTYSTYIENNVLLAAGMEDSYVHDSASSDSTATAHSPWFGGKRALTENKTGLGSAPQGGIVATASDMARYLQIMMNGEDDLISAESKALMMTPANDASPDYGFGWFIDPVQGTVFHSGSNPGYETLATMVPAERKAAVVLVNAGSGALSGETLQLRNGITARALGLDYAGEADPWQMRATMIGLIILPIIYVLSMIWAWRKRTAIRAKSGWSGKFSLWFPLVTTCIFAWVIFRIVPPLFGAPFGTIQLFQPDMGLAMAATAVLGVVWAVFRLGVAYTGKPQRTESPPSKAT